MLDDVAQLLNRTRRVTFLADRGFRNRAWARKCQTLGWDYIIRIANNTLITFLGGVVATPKRSISSQMRSVIYQTFASHLRPIGPATWQLPGHGQHQRALPNYVLMTNLRPSGWVLRHYLKRMYIKESFRDDKSGGFDLHVSYLTDVKRLDTLLLALSIAVLWIYELGEQALLGNERKTVDPAYKRQLSVFKLGGGVKTVDLLCHTSTLHVATEVIQATTGLAW